MRIRPNYAFCVLCTARFSFLSVKSLSFLCTIIELQPKGTKKSRWDANKKMAGQVQCIVFSNNRRTTRYISMHYYFIRH